MFNNHSYHQLETKVKILERSCRNFRKKTAYSKLEKIKLGILYITLLLVFDVIAILSEVFLNKIPLMIVIYAFVLIITYFITPLLYYVARFHLPVMFMNIELLRREGFKYSVQLTSPTIKTLKQQEQTVEHPSFFKNENELIKLKAMRIYNA